jgi:hypothetical protein
VGVPQRSRSARRARRSGVRPALLAVLVVTLTTIGASAGVLWLATHLLPHAVPPADGEEAPMADVVEILKVALAVGLSRWTVPDQ